MAKKLKHKYHPGDILKLKRNWSDKKRGEHTIIIGYDYLNYVVINLNKDDLIPYSMVSSPYDDERFYEKIVSVDLQKLPLNIERQIDHATEEFCCRGPSDNLSDLLKSTILKPYFNKIE